MTNTVAGNFTGNGNLDAWSPRSTTVAAHRPPGRPCGTRTPAAAHQPTGRGGMDPAAMSPVTPAVRHRASPCSLAHPSVDHHHHGEQSADDEHDGNRHRGEQHWNQCARRTAQAPHRRPVSDSRSFPVGRNPTAGHQSRRVLASLHSHWLSRTNRQLVRQQARRSPDHGR